MARKDRLTNVQRELMYLTSFQDRIDRFLKSYSRPTRRYDKLRDALEEVSRERLLLLAAQEDRSEHSASTVR